MILKTIGLPATTVLAAIDKVFKHLLSHQLMHFMDPFLGIIM